jgi:hypothetical protein
MIAQFVLSILLAGILHARSPAIAMLAVFVSTAGRYFVWGEHSTQLAELVGIGRGVDLICARPQTGVAIRRAQCH